MKKGVIGIIFSVFAILVSSLLLFISINLDKKNILLSYNVNNNITYSINTTDTAFYDKNNITDNNSFPIDFIDSIDVNFINNISFNKQINLENSYEIYARIEIIDSNKEVNNIIYSKNYKLLEENNIIYNNIIQNNITKTVNIDYKMYNDVVNKYKLKIKMPVEAKLKVIMKSNNKNSMLDNNEELVLSMPLSVNTISITKDFVKNYSGNVYERIENKYIYITCSILIIVLSIFVFIFSVRNVYFNRKDYRTIKLNKILRYYEQVIVMVSNPPKIVKESILKVNEFKDMIDLNRELRQPILYYKNNNDEYGLFIIINNQTTYIYEISSKREKI